MKYLNPLYIGKTKYIDKLIPNIENKNRFLARPRRFGKTIFVNTLKQFLRGIKKLFRGLYIRSKGFNYYSGG
ncbi:MAG: AAA family ATPase [Deltaproteobacteria bacterium]|nr:AAA family ATPase [Deltaproteobacteria bacterium]